ncbi:MAG: hypothetical protein ACYC69_12115 [Thermodesulfovibrionales bacterium]
MRKIALLMLLTILISGCGGGGDLAAPPGSVITITPSSTADTALKITSSSTVQKSVLQIYQIRVTDFDNSSNGVRDTIFDLTYELTTVPGTTVSDLSTLVTLCDGTSIVNTLAQRQTDGNGNYDLCLVFKTGSGLTYEGNLRVLSGGQSALSKIAVESTIPDPVVSPGSLTIPSGSSGLFTITGGSPSYTVTSSRPGIEPVPAVVSSIGGTFGVTIPAGTPKGTIVVCTVRDSAGKSAITTITVDDPPPITVLPSATTVVAGGSAQFTITGGQPNYTIVSSDAAAVVSPGIVTASGGTFTVTVPARTPAGAITVTVRDSLGATKDATITVQAPPTLTILPGSIQVTAGNIATFAIVGGVPGYTIVSNNASVQPGTAHVNASGDTFTVPVLSTVTATSVTLTVVDAVGTTATASLSIKPLPFIITPSSDVLAPGVSRNFIISGGAPIYQVTSDHPADVFFGPAPGTASTSTSGSFTVTVKNPTTTAVPFVVRLTVTDSEGQQREATIQVN